MGGGVVVAAVVVGVEEAVVVNERLEAAVLLGEYECRDLTGILSADAAQTTRDDGRMTADQTADHGKHRVLYLVAVQTTSGSP